MPPRDRSYRSKPAGSKPLVVTVAAALVALLAYFVGPQLTAERAPANANTSEPASLVTHRDIGFRSRDALDDHFQKHGREFGDIHKGTYLESAQTLRDRPLSASVREIVRDDGMITRFDAESGAFVAFDERFVIRTFFRPDDGARYFERQAYRAFD